MLSAASLLIILSRCCHVFTQSIAHEPYRLRILNGNNARVLIVYFRYDGVTDGTTNDK